VTATRGALGRPGLLVAILLSVPLAAYTAWLAYDEPNGVKRLEAASELPAEGAGERLSGVLYRVSGPASAEWLTAATPNPWPESAGAAAFRVTTETLDDRGKWSVGKGAVTTGQVEEMRIAGVPIVVGKWARLMLPAVDGARQISATERQLLDARIGAGKDLVAWGTYQHGRLVDSATQRLFVGVRGEEPKIYEQLEIESAFKARILWMMAAAAALSGLLAAWRLRARGQTQQ
jgi:hypothetical protein